MQKKIPLYISLITAVLAVVFYFLSYPSASTIKDQTEKHLHKLEQKANLQLDSIHQHLHHSSKKHFVEYLAKEYATTFNERGIAYFIYENDSLQFWTDNHPAVENYMLNICLEKRLVKLKNGYYEVIRHPKNAYSPFQLYALVLIKNNFPYENKYLKNEFNKRLRIPDGVLINDNEQNHSIQISNYQGLPVFIIDIQEGVRNQFTSLLSFLCLCFSLFCMLFYLKKRFVQRESLKWIAFVLLTIALLCYLIFQLNVLYIPISLSYDRQNLYNLIVAFLISTLSVWVFIVFRKEVTSNTKTKNRLIYFALFIAFLFVSGFGLNLFLATIFSKSYLSSDLSDVIFSSSLEIYLSYACVFLVMFCFVIFCETVINLLNITYNKIYIILFLSLTAICILIHHLFGQADILTAVWSGLLFLLIVVSKKLCANNRFLYGTLLCLFISFFLAYLSIDQKNKSDYTQRLNIMDDLADPQDDIAEHLFKSLETKIIKDKELTRIGLKKDKTIADIEQSILRKYFTGYWEKYHVSVCLFDSLCTPLVQHPQSLYNNNTYFDELISSKLQSTTCPNLYFNGQLKDKTFYLYKTPIKSLSKSLQLYIVIESKKTHTYKSFPDLLLIHSSHTANTEYSSAVYKAGQLHSQQGRYEYPALFLFRMMFRIRESFSKTDTVI